MAAKVVAAVVAAAVRKRRLKRVADFSVKTQPIHLPCGNRYLPKFSRIYRRFRQHRLHAHEFRSAVVLKTTSPLGTLAVCSTK